ncbi:inositol monophosphatase family protein [Aneurinibacillus tyrosinisolvens]|uniref:inositol monophosphatase family protein n=1 Tax=Aneurinibacillus tyrosinisolvens TaxID=1443435 RepID=UPI00063FC298|nr:inositol monophosphatase [Aneurinibacillus tyrosinisolvens]
MQNTNKKEWGKLARHCAKEAGKLITRMLEQPLEVMCKTSASDLVTSVDRAVEKLVMDTILEAYPDHGILGEEGLFAEDISRFDTVWVVDPIDGTTNFVHQQQNYCISIAVCHQGRCEAAVVYDPTREELFYAEREAGAFLNDVPLAAHRTMTMEQALLSSSIFWNSRAMESGLSEKVQQLARASRGMRVYGVAALELAYVAAGRLDAYISMSLNPWDYAGGKLLIEESGARVTRLNGEPIPFGEKSSILAANPAIYDSLLDFLKPD